jgi:hypothetical protein
LIKEFPLFVFVSKNTGYIENYSAEADLITPALEARSPLLAATAEGKPGRLPARREGLEISRKGVWLTALGKNPDGPGLVLRLWEYSGISGPCQLKIPADWKAEALQPVDLRGRPTDKPLLGVNGTFKLDLKAFAPVSFVLHPTSPSSQKERH